MPLPQFPREKVDAVLLLLPFWNLLSQKLSLIKPLSLCLSLPDGFLAPPCPPPLYFGRWSQQLYLRNSSRKNYYHHFLFLHFTFRILGKIGMVPFEVMCYLAVRGFKPLDQIESGSKFCYLRGERGKLPGQLNLTAQSPMKHQSFLS